MITMKTFFRIIDVQAKKKCTALPKHQLAQMNTSEFLITGKFQ
jgi:hypothetical protein